MATSLLKQSMMVLEQRASIDLPAHLTPGGFDHAAIHSTSARVYVAHTANDALDGIDCARERYLHSIANLAGMAGVLVSNEEPVCSRPTAAKIRWRCSRLTDAMLCPIRHSGYQVIQTRRFQVIQGERVPSWKLL